MYKNIGLFMTLAILVTLLLTGCSTSSSSSVQPSTSSAAKTPKSGEAPPNQVGLKIGSLPRIFDLIAYVAKQDGIFQKYNLQVEIVPFRSTVEMNNALLSGQTDGAIQGTFEAVNLNKENINAKLVGHNFMTRMFEVVVSPSSGISNSAQLKGKEIANGTGTIMEYAADQLLKSQGLKGNDVTYVNVPNIALRVEMLNQGKVPAAVLTSPISDLAVSSGGKIILDDSKQLLGGPGLLFSANALNTKSDGIARFVKAWQEAVDLINANQQKYHSLLISVANVPEAVANKLTVPYFPRLRLPTEAEINSISDWMIAKGLMNQWLPYDNVVESKYIK